MTRARLLTDFYETNPIHTFIYSYSIPSAFRVVLVATGVDLTSSPAQEQALLFHSK
jgi:hypothetical protein